MKVLCIDTSDISKDYKRYTSFEIVENEVYDALREKVTNGVGYYLIYDGPECELWYKKNRFIPLSDIDEMETTTLMHLNSPIYSYMQPGKIYGQAGDEVTVISVHHQVAIVENMDKQRFPAPVDSLSEQSVKNATQLSDILLIKQPIRKQKKAVTNTNPSLF